MPRLRIGAVAFGGACLAAAWVSAQATARPPSQARIRGFSERESAAEAARERAFKALPSAPAAEADFDVMTAEPHHVGSPYEIKLADYVGDRFKALGFALRDALTPSTTVMSTKGMVSFEDE